MRDNHVRSNTCSGSEPDAARDGDQLYRKPEPRLFGDEATFLLTGGDVPVLSPNGGETAHFAVIDHES